ncbi:gas vesicle protein GvpN [Halodesulfurarchaeum sp.]|uniref:gas vesicle protein GvpN n=1 Tax=Halodesulfurarchaeum sp. TaxID=1980530 RepID=UPI003FA5C8E6
MTQNGGTDDRKVRGSQIRTSQSEKQHTRQEKELQRMSQAVNNETQDLQQSDLSESVAIAEQPFVETDEIQQLKRRLHRWIEANHPIHLIGPTGCGKTALAIEVARELDRPVVWINGDAELNTNDLVGEYAQEERYSERDKYIHNVIKSKDIIRDRWVDNPLTLAVKEGGTLVYNEFSRTKPVANNVLLSVFEEGVLELPGKRGESRFVEVHPEFRAILTSNSVEYAGVHEPQDALLDRLVGVYMDFYDFETEMKIVSKHVDEDLSQSEIESIVDIFRELRGILEINVGTRAEIMAAEGLAEVDRKDMETFREICVDVLASKVAQQDELSDLREQVENILEAQELSE